ncbi:hypothetical protein BDV95DRAFT_638896 [Massariosphaeria phaeospora]|uniref:Uncharacterized protein n=1 Tax=Massariosphaeria phaeospora TaxID=100035 RepID=A0A7C8I8L4_9PLEO|nr:hypothetical protein BDV95DRAFT_638896 [Massariosphaeria phaeospora]
MEEPSVDVMRARYGIQINRQAEPDAQGLQDKIKRLEAERDAILAEHEAALEKNDELNKFCDAKTERANQAENRSLAEFRGRAHAHAGTTFANIGQNHLKDFANMVRAQVQRDEQRAKMKAIIAHRVAESVTEPTIEKISNNHEVQQSLSEMIDSYRDLAKRVRKASALLVGLAEPLPSTKANDSQIGRWKVEIRESELVSALNNVEDIESADSLLRRCITERMEPVSLPVHLNDPLNLFCRSKDPEALLEIELQMHYFVFLASKARDSFSRQVQQRSDIAEDEVEHICANENVSFLTHRAILSDTDFDPLQSQIPTEILNEYVGRQLAVSNWNSPSSVFEENDYEKYKRDVKGRLNKSMKAQLNIILETYGLKSKDFDSECAIVAGMAMPAYILNSILRVPPPAGSPLLPLTKNRQETEKKNILQATAQKTIMEMRMRDAEASDRREKIFEAQLDAQEGFINNVTGITQHTKKAVTESIGGMIKDTVKRFPETYDLTSQPIPQQILKEWNKETVPPEQLAMLLGSLDKVVKPTSQANLATNGIGPPNGPTKRSLSSPKPPSKRPKIGDLNAELGLSDAELNSSEESVVKSVEHGE